MALAIKPGAYLRRGRAAVSPEAAMFLVEDALEALEMAAPRGWLGSRHGVQAPFNPAHHETH